MAFIRAKHSIRKKMKMSVQENLVKLYDNRGDEHLLKLSHNHRIVLRSIINNYFNGSCNGYKINSLNQSCFYDLLSWGMVDYKIRKYGQVLPEVLGRYANVENEKLSEVRHRCIMGVEKELIVPTHYGLAVQSYLNLNNKKNQSGHNNIIYDFIKSRKEMNQFVFEDMEIKTSYGVSRPDIYTVQKTLNESNIKPTAYEVKHSRSDFLSDMKKPEKWKSYLEVAEKLYYVCPEGIIKKEDVPNECGLIYQLQDKSFKTIKQAKKGKGQITVGVMMKMMLRMESDPDIVLIKPGINPENIDLDFFDHD